MNILTAIWTFLTSGVGIWSAGGVGVLIISYILNKYVGEKLWKTIGIGIENLFFVLFSAIDIFLNKITKNIFNKVIEPSFKIFLNVIFASALKGSLRGLDANDTIPDED